MSAMSVRGQYGSRIATTSGRRLVAGIADRAELMEGYQICAKCGVDDFTQRPCRRDEA
jgi:hypothetical protein